ncbi:MAG: hypothetical protein WC627_09425 [Legionella sp.]|jgi:hypothetical protein
MNKYLFFVLVIFGLSSCTVKDERYYRSNPRALQAALKLCPEQAPTGLTCQQLEQIAIPLNSLGHQLQYNPQEFGAKILKLQETIAQQKAQLAKNTQDKDLEKQLQENTNDLAERMAVVKWLESPES